MKPLMVFDDKISRHCHNRIYEKVFILPGNILLKT